MLGLEAKGRLHDVVTPTLVRRARVGITRNPEVVDAFHAMGYEGQCVSIIPSKRLVVVRLGLTREPSAWRQDRFVNKVVAAMGG